MKKLIVLITLVLISLSVKAIEKQDIIQYESKIKYYINMPDFSVDDKKKIDLANSMILKNELKAAYEIYFKLSNTIQGTKNERKLRYINIKIGHLYSYINNWDAALKAFGKAIQTENSVGNPLLHLRIGQCGYHLKKKRIYDDNLARALITGGLKVFDNEKNELKAIALSLLDPPGDGWGAYDGIDFSVTK